MSNSYQRQCAEDAAQCVIDLIDTKTLLGAAFDCMSPEAQAQFKRSLIHIIEREAYKQISCTTELVIPLGADLTHWVK